MHDRKLDEPDQPHRAPGDELSIALTQEIIERLREQRQEPLTINGKQYYVFRPLKGRNGFYDRQVNDDREE